MVWREAAYWEKMAHCSNGVVWVRVANAASCLIQGVVGAAIVEARARRAEAEIKGPISSGASLTSVGKVIGSAAQSRRPCSLERLLFSCFASTSPAKRVTAWRKGK